MWTESNGGQEGGENEGLTTQRCRPVVLQAAQRIAAVAAKMPGLRAMVHVSTACEPQLSVRPQALLCWLQCTGAPSGPLCSAKCGRQPYPGGARSLPAPPPPTPALRELVGSSQAQAAGLAIYIKHQRLAALERNTLTCQRSA